MPSAAKGIYPQVLSKGVPLPVRQLCLFVCNQTAYANNLTGVVDWLLITSGVCMWGCVGVSQNDTPLICDIMELLMIPSCLETPPHPKHFNTCNLFSESVFLGNCFVTQLQSVANHCILLFSVNMP